MKVNVIQLVFNDVKLTKSIVNQLDCVTKDQIIQIEATGKVLGYVKARGRKLILIEDNQMLYKLRWFDWEKGQPGLYSLVHKKYRIAFDTQASRDKYLDVYNKLKERAVEHIFI